MLVVVLFMMICSFVPSDCLTYWGDTPVDKEDEEKVAEKEKEEEKEAEKDKKEEKEEEKDKNTEKNRDSNKEKGSPSHEDKDGKGRRGEDNVKHEEL